MIQNKQPSQFTLLAALSAVILITVMSAFVIVWLQQQISRTAQTTKSVESELSETLRKVAHLDALIATRHQPAFLQGQVMGKLRPARDEQIVWVNGHRQVDGWAYSHYKPYRSSGDLAQASLQRFR
jgi:predicted Holliday junction resolvase-like endonuclease